MKQFLVAAVSLAVSGSAFAKTKIIDLDQYDLNSTYKGIALNYSVRSQPVGGGVHTIHQIPGGGAVDQCADTQTAQLKAALDDSAAKPALKKMGITSVSILLATDSGDDTMTNCMPDAKGGLGSYFVRAIMTTDGKCNPVPAAKMVKDISDASGVCVEKGGKLPVKVGAAEPASGAGAAAN